MKYKMSILLLVCLLFPLFLWTQTYEITEIDIFSLGKLPTSKEITVNGISFRSSFKEALEKFGRNEEHLRHRDKYYFVKGLHEGMVIRSLDRNNI